MSAMQFAALPVRHGPAGLEVLMVTSRETARWVIPKGWPMAGLPPHAAAAREAFEEAGIRGTVGDRAIGGYTYWKFIRGRGVVKALLCTVEVFPFLVREELAQWPEHRQRQRAWFPAAEAVGLVDEAVLGDLIRRVGEEPALVDIPARPARKPRKKPGKAGAKGKAKSAGKSAAKIGLKIKAKAKTGTGAKAKAKSAKAKSAKAKSAMPKPPKTDPAGRDRKAAAPAKKARAARKKAG